MQASQLVLKAQKTLIEFFASVNKLKNYLIHLFASLKNLKDEFNFLQGFKRMNVFSEALKNLKES